MGNRKWGIKSHFTFIQKEVNDIVKNVFKNVVSLSVSEYTVRVYLNNNNYILINLYQSDGGWFSVYLRKDYQSIKVDNEFETTDLNIYSLLIKCKNKLDSLNKVA